MNARSTSTVVPPPSAEIGSSTATSLPARPFLPLVLHRNTSISPGVRDHVLFQNGLFHSTVPLPICNTAILTDRQCTHEGYWSLDSTKDEHAWVASSAGSSADHLRADVDWPLDTALAVLPIPPFGVNVSKAVPMRDGARAGDVEKILEREERDRRADRQPTRSKKVRQLRGIVKRTMSQTTTTAEARVKPSNGAVASAISSAFVRETFDAATGTLKSDVRDRAWEPIYSPTYCHMLPISYTALVKSHSLRGQRWLFLGDSLTRYSFVSLIHFLAKGIWSVREPSHVPRLA